MLSAPAQRFPDAFFEANLRLETKQLSCLLDRWDSNLDIRNLLLLEHDPRFGFGKTDHLLRQRENRCRLLGIADIQDLADRLFLPKDAEDGVDKVIYVAPGSDLVAIAGHPQIFISQCVDAELPDRTLADLPRAIDVERAKGRDWQPVFKSVGKSEVLRCHLANRVGPPGFSHRSLRGQAVLVGAVDVRSINLACREHDEA